MPSSTTYFWSGKYGGNLHQNLISKDVLEIACDNRLSESGSDRVAMFRELVVSIRDQWAGAQVLNSAQRDNSAAIALVEEGGSLAIYFASGKKKHDRYFTADCERGVLSWRKTGKVSKDDEFVLNTRICVFKTRNCVSKAWSFEFKMMNYAVCIRWRQNDEACGGRGDFKLEDGERVV